MVIIMKKSRTSHENAISYLKKQDKILKNVIDKIGYCALDHTEREPFDTLASSIISQQLSIKAANTIKNRILESIEITRPLQPESFAGISVEQLRTCGLSKAKSNYLILLGKNIINNDLNLDELKQMDDEEVIKELSKQPGIGRWTSEMFLIFCLGREDVLSLADVGLRRAAMGIYKLDRKPTDSEFIKIAKNWKPFRSIASWYLWRFID